jgi:hypothetical protein
LSRWRYRKDSGGGAKSGKGLVKASLKRWKIKRTAHKAKKIR